MTNLYPVILCGGSGTRLWPLSRGRYPKQFIDFGFGTLFEKTLDRIETLAGVREPIVVCNEEYRFFVSGLLQEQGKKATILLEPEGRNTAPAVALAAFAAKQLEEDPLLLVLPSDHLIDSISTFHHAVLHGVSVACDGLFVMFGIVPTRPETGFGYLQEGKEIDKNIYHVTQFVEKPDVSKAKEFFELGIYTWNSGIFLFRASAYLCELKKLAPEIFMSCESAWSGHIQDPLGFFRPNKQAFLASPSGSIDYVLMEKTDKACMVKLDTVWNDLGSWEAFYNAEEADIVGNILHGDVIAQDTENCYLNSTKRLLCTIGVKNLIVVETGDAVLVVDRNHAQDVKKLLEQQIASRTESETHVRVFRPWGSYEVLASGVQYKVKKIVVSPGSSLSLQLHHRRAEHWIVVSGTAYVTLNGEEHIVEEDQSIYIPLGSHHRLANYGEQPLELIEVQSGMYLGEDDIVRLEDEYGRIN